MYIDSVQFYLDTYYRLLTNHWSSLSIRMCNYFFSRGIYSNSWIGKNLDKLREINFHTMDISDKEINLMIDHFGDFTEENNTLDTINSDSCTRLLLKYYFLFGHLNEIKVRSIAWICARFPNLKDIEFNRVSNVVRKEILENILFKDDNDRFLKYLRQINWVICKDNYKSFDDNTFYLEMK